MPSPSLLQAETDSGESTAERASREYQQASTAEVELLRVQVRMLGEELQQFRADYRALLAAHADQHREWLRAGEDYRVLHVAYADQQLERDRLQVENARLRGEFSRLKDNLRAMLNEF